jgi:hypothetical protein
MVRLITAPNIDAPDDVYALLVDLHAGLDDRRSAITSAKLVLLFANHIGDVAIIREAVEAARRN